jgi:hypothetical protein
MAEQKTDSCDLIWGADAIAKELGLTTRTVFHMLSKGHLPGRRIGRRWVASKTALRARLYGEDIA